MGPTHTETTLPVPDPASDWEAGHTGFLIRGARVLPSGWTGRAWLGAVNSTFYYLEPSGTSEGGYVDGSLVWGGEVSYDASSATRASTWRAEVGLEELTDIALFSTAHHSARANEGYTYISWHVLLELRKPLGEGLVTYGGLRLSDYRARWTFEGGPMLFTTQLYELESNTKAGVVLGLETYQEPDRISGFFEISFPDAWVVAAGCTFRF